jgi:hypothetical protein
LPAIALRERGYKGPLFRTPGLLNADFVRVGGQAVEGIIVSAGPAIVAEQLPDDHFAKRQALAFRTAYLKANGASAIDGSALSNRSQSFTTESQADFRMQNRKLENLELRLQANWP